ncbi:MAG: PAS domain-containing protein, partial [Promethearchaeota archaeon]
EFIENSLLGIGVLQDGRIIYANNTILKHFGYSFDEIQEKNFWMKVIHPKDLPIVKRKIEFKLKERKYNTTRYKCRIILKSGESKWIEVFSKKFYHDDRLAILFTIIEIPEPTPLIELSKIDSAKLNVMEELLKGFKIPYQILKAGDFQKDLEEKLLKEKIALKDAEKKYLHLFEASPFSILLLNFEGRIIECNNATEKLFNFKKDELIGKKFLEVINFQARYLHMVEVLYGKLTNGEKLLPIEAQCFTKEGKPIRVRISNSLIRLYNEILIHVIINDIPQLKST